MDALVPTVGMFIYVKFPEWFEFVGTETSCFNQVGNAIPPLFAFHLAGMVRNYLRSSKRLSPSEIVEHNLSLQLIV